MLQLDAVTTPTTRKSKTWLVTTKHYKNMNSTPWLGVGRRREPPSWGVVIEKHWIFCKNRSHDNYPGISTWWKFARRAMAMKV